MRQIVRKPFDHGVHLQIVETDNVLVEDIFPTLPAAKEFSINQLNAKLGEKNLPLLTEAKKQLSINCCLNMNIIDDLIAEIDSKTINLEEKDIIERLIDRHRWPYKYHTGHPTLERIDAAGEKWQDFYLPDGWPDVNKVLNYYDSGYTFILSGVQNLNSQVLEITNILEHFFQANVNANMYLGKGTSSISFPRHQHEYHVLVKNVFGDSGWIINQRYQKLQKQDSIFIPAHTDHQVIEIFNIKATITFNIWTDQLFK